MKRLVLLSIFFQSCVMQLSKANQEKKKMYISMFEVLLNRNKDENFQSPILKLRDYFLNNFFIQNMKVGGTPPNIVDELVSLAQSQAFQKKYQTHVYGISKGNNADKVIISGARGATGDKNDYISSISMVEANEGSSSGMTVAYGIRYPNNKWLTEAKITNFNLIGNEENDTYIVSFAEGEKQQYDGGKKIVGYSRVHRLVIGGNFLKYVSYLMIVGSMIGDLELKSTSTLMVSNYFINSALEVKATKAGFLSTNTANAEKSKSFHQSFFSVDEEDLKVLKSSKALSVGEDNVAYTKGAYDEQIFAAKK